MIRRPPRSTLSSSSAASDVYKRQALSVSVGGLIISWFVGYRLPGLEYNNQKVEAAFRKDLVLGEDDKVNYAQTDTLWNLFTGIRFNYQRLYLHYGYFDIWLSLIHISEPTRPY